MVAKPYAWEAGATLEDHTKRKHKILREYFARYLAVRCQRPQQTRFRLAIIEGFAGGGRYACGTAGSPLIFVEELRSATEEFNLKRASEGMAPLEIECLLVLNDATPEVVALLRDHMEPVLAAAKAEVPKLHLHAKYMNQPFDEAYPAIKQFLERAGYRNVLFNLDQCGHSHVDPKTIVDVMRSFASAEIFYTFAIESLLTFLPKSDPKLLSAQLGFLGVPTGDLDQLAGLMSNQTWLGAAERMVFESFRNCAPYVSPFSINNPDGWRYWFIHFANFYRARQEYNNMLHKNSSMQAHFGRSGLHMLSYNPTDQNNELYLFDVSGRSAAQEQLAEDIPRLVTDFGDAVSVAEFYESIYNMTPAHMDDIHAAIIKNPDLEVITEAGGERRKARTIGPGDTLRMKRQRTFFPLFLGEQAPLKK